MKKLCILLCVVMVVSLAGCNRNNNVRTGQTNNPAGDTGTAQGNNGITNTGTAQGNNGSTNTGTAQSNKSGSNNTNNKENTTTANYKDGVYTAYGDKWKYGQESATVTIKKGKIIYITLKRLDTKGKEVNYNEWTGQKEANGSVKPNLKKYRVDLAKKMLTNQSYEVNGIAGATVSSGGWRVAVQRALDKAKQ